MIRMLNVKLFDVQHSNVECQANFSAAHCCILYSSLLMRITDKLIPVKFRKFKAAKKTNHKILKKTKSHTK